MKGDSKGGRIYQCIECGHIGMRKYHKINTLFKRDIEKGGRRKGKIIEGEWSLPEFEYLANNRWSFSEKLDGTNIRVHWNGSGRRIGGRTDNAQIYAPLFHHLLEIFPEKKLRDVFLEGEEKELDITIFGEGIGPKIQKGGGNYGDGVSFVLFDILIGEWWLKRENIEDIAQKLEIPIVPIIGEGTLHDAVELARMGFNSAWGDFPAEGIVMRPAIELKRRNGDRIIGKIKLKDFR